MMLNGFVMKSSAPSFMIWAISSVEARPENMMIFKYGEGGSSRNWRQT